MSEYDLNLNEENDVDNLSTDMFDCTQHSDIGNVNSKILQNILDKKRNDIKKVKTTEEWMLHSSQIEIKNNESLQNEQNQVIVELQTKANQFLQRAENETHMRVKVNVEMEKIKKNIATFKNYYEALKKSMERCIESKNKLETAYRQSVVEIEQQIKENNTKIKSYMMKNIKIKKILSNELEKRSKSEREYSIMQKQKEEQISTLEDEKSKLVDFNKHLEENNKKLLQQIQESLSENGELLEELTKCKENYERVVEELQRELESVKHLLHVAEQQQSKDKKIIETLTEDLESHKKSLKDQSEFMNQVLAKDEQIENNISDLEKENENLKNVINDYKIELEITKFNLQSDLTIAQNSCTQLEDSINVLKEDYNHLKQEYETAQDIIVTLTKNIEEKQDNENKLRQSLSELEMNIINLQKETAEYQNLIVNLKEEIKNKTDTIDRLNDNYADLERKYKNSTTILQDRYDNVFIEKENLKHENEMIRLKMMEIKEESEKNIKEIVEHNETYKNELEKIRQNEKAKLTSDIAKLTETVKTMELQMNELRASKQSIQNELNHKIRETVQLTEEKEKLLYNNDKTQNDLPFNSNQQLSDQSVSEIEKNIQIEKPKAQKRTYMHKIRKRLPWNDSWSDSSIENEYVGKAWKPKLPDNSQRLIPVKRKILSTPVNDEAHKNNDELFDSLKTTSSTPLKQQNDNKSVKKQKSDRKAF